MADTVQQKRPEEVEMGTDHKTTDPQRDVEVGAEQVDIDRIEKVYK